MIQFFSRSEVAVQNAAFNFNLMAQLVKALFLLIKHSFFQQNALSFFAKTRPSSSDLSGECLEHLFLLCESSSSFLQCLMITCQKLILLFEQPLLSPKLMLLILHCFPPLLNVNLTRLHLANQTLADLLLK